MKKILALILMVIMLVSIMPITLMAETEAYLEGIRIEPGKFYLSSGNTIEETTEDLAELWYADDTLYLKNFKIDLENTKDGIYWASKIKVSGENEILNAKEFGMHANDLSITGENKSSDTLKISSKYDVLQAYNIDLENITFTVNDYRQDDGIYACGNLSIKNSILDITTKYRGIYSEYDIHIDDSKLNMHITGNNYNIDNESYATGVFSNEGDLIINNSELEIETDCVASVIDEESYIETNPIYITKKIYFNSGTIKIKHPLFSYDDVYYLYQGLIGRSGIYFSNDYSIENVDSYYDFYDESGEDYPEGENGYYDYETEEFENGVTDCILAEDGQWLTITCQSSNTGSVFSSGNSVIIICGCTVLLLAVGAVIVLNKKKVNGK